MYYKKINKLIHLGYINKYIIHKTMCIYKLITDAYNNN